MGFGDGEYTSAIQSHFSVDPYPRNFWVGLLVACGFAEFFSYPDRSKMPGDAGWDLHFSTPAHKEDEKVKPGSESLRDILNRCETQPPPEIDNETIGRVKTISKKKYNSLFEKKAPVKVISQAKAMEMRNNHISLVCCKICNRVFVGK